MGAPPWPRAHLSVERRRYIHKRRRTGAGASSCPNRQSSIHHVQRADSRSHRYDWEPTTIGSFHSLQASQRLPVVNRLPSCFHRVVGMPDLGCRQSRRRLISDGLSPGHGDSSARHRRPIELCGINPNRLNCASPLVQLESSSRLHQPLLRR
jgi:hypothetical protein